MGCAQDNQSQTPYRQILLLNNVLVTGHHNRKSTHLGCGKKIAVGQCGPPKIRRMSNVVSGKNTGKSIRDVVIEKNPHCL
jgi:hypothetical protein